MSEKPISWRSSGAPGPKAWAFGAAPDRTEWSDHFASDSMQQDEGARQTFPSEALRVGDQRQEELVESLRKRRRDEADCALVK